MDAAVKRPLLCELIGPTGAGKSTTCATLSAIDSAVRVRGGISKRNHLVPLVVHTLTFLPGALLVFLQCGRFGVREIKQLARLRVMDRALQNDESASALIIDEGPVFTLAWIQALGERTVISSPWFRSRVEREVRRWAERLDLLIWLDASDDLLTRRIRMRSQPHYKKGSSDSEVASFLNRYRETYREVIGRLQSYRGQNVVEFNTESDSGIRIAQKILSAVNCERPVN